MARLSWREAESDETAEDGLQGSAVSERVYLATRSGDFAFHSLLKHYIRVSVCIIFIRAKNRSSHVANIQDLNVTIHRSIVYIVRIDVSTGLYGAEE